MSLFEFLSLIAVILTSGAVFGFAQFLITRHDNKKNTEKMVVKVDEKVDEKFDELSKKVDEKVDALSDKVDQNAAVLARTHILRFSDEIKNGVVHSSEYWRQTLDDCDTYSEFCEAHKGFRNSYTTLADKHIKETYEKLTKEGKL